MDMVMLCRLCLQLRVARPTQDVCAICAARMTRDWPEEVPQEHLGLPPKERP